MTRATRLAAQAGAIRHSKHTTRTSERTAIDIGCAGLEFHLAKLVADAGKAGRDEIAGAHLKFPGTRVVSHLQKLDLLADLGDRLFHGLPSGLCGWGSPHRRCRASHELWNRFELGRQDNL